MALTTRPRNYPKADKLVQACLAFCGTSSVPWWIENPESGQLKGRPFMKERKYQKVSYCKYSSASEPCCPESAEPCAVCKFRGKYQKHTAIWTNTTWVPEIEPCGAGCRCPYVVNDMHPEKIGAGLRGRRAYPVPGRLTREIFTYLRDQAS